MRYRFSVAWAQKFFAANFIFAWALGLCALYTVPKESDLRLAVYDTETQSVKADYRSDGWAQSAYRHYAGLVPLVGPWMEERRVAAYLDRATWLKGRSDTLWVVCFSSSVLAAMLAFIVAWAAYPAAIKPEYWLDSQARAALDAWVAQGGDPRWQQREDASSAGDEEKAGALNALRAVLSQAAIPSEALLKARARCLGSLTLKVPDPELIAAIGMVTLRLSVRSDVRAEPQAEDLAWRCIRWSLDKGYQGQELLDWLLLWDGAPEDLQARAEEALSRHRLSKPSRDLWSLRSLFKRGHSAKELLEHLKPGSPPPMEALMLQAQLLDASGQYTLADSVWDRLLNVDPRDRRIWELSLASARRRGDGKRFIALQERRRKDQRGVVPWSAWYYGDPQLPGRAKNHFKRWWEQQDLALQAAVTILILDVAVSVALVLMLSVSAQGADLTWGQIQGCLDLYLVLHFPLGFWSGLKPVLAQALGDNAEGLNLPLLVSPNWNIVAVVLGLALNQGITTYALCRAWHWRPWRSGIGSKRRGFYGALLITLLLAACTGLFYLRKSHEDPFSGPWHLVAFVNPFPGGHRWELGKLPQYPCSSRPDEAEELLSLLSQPELPDLALDPSGEVRSNLWPEKKVVWELRGKNVYIVDQARAELLGRLDHQDGGLVLWRMAKYLGLLFLNHNDPLPSRSDERYHEIGEPARHWVVYQQYARLPTQPGDKRAYCFPNHRDYPKETFQDLGPLEEIQMLDWPGDPAAPPSFSVPQ